MTNKSLTKKKNALSRLMAVLVFIKFVQGKLKKMLNILIIMQNYFPKLIIFWQVSNQYSNTQIIIVQRIPNIYTIKLFTYMLN